MALPTASDGLLSSSESQKTAQFRHFSRLSARVCTVSLLFGVFFAFTTRLHHPTKVSLPGVDSNILARKRIIPTLCAEALSKFDTASGDIVFQDMHDGDMKKIRSNEKGLIIEPFENDEVWKVMTGLPDDTCSFSVDFQVPGKPGPPPVPLRLQLALIKSLVTATEEVSNVVAVFYDPSGTLADSTKPLNVWYGTSL